MTSLPKVLPNGWHQAEQHSNIKPHWWETHRTPGPKSCRANHSGVSLLLHPNLLLLWLLCAFHSVSPFPAHFLHSFPPRLSQHQVTISVICQWLHVYMTLLTWSRAAQWRQQWSSSGFPQSSLHLGSCVTAVVLHTLCFLVTSSSNHPWNHLLNKFYF